MTTDQQEMNPPAFACAAENGHQTGMTLRDWFAGQCDVMAYTPIETFYRKRRRYPTINELAAYITEIRCIEADAMLATRKEAADV